ncbi:nicotinate (nicotinamide) nucleotide adenylyltransferase [soil metagenome]
MNAELASARRGILGGAFNPPHVAHLIVAHLVREALALDEVVLVPSCVHAFKGESEASPIQRATMAELAVAGDRCLAVDRIEVRRGGTSYTVETLDVLREREPGTRWHLILGQDNLSELPDWKQMERLPELAEIVVVTRGEAALKPGLPFPERCILVHVPDLEISSTAIRGRVAAGHSIRYWVSPPVEAFIREQGLYRTEPSTSD